METTAGETLMVRLDRLRDLYRQLASCPDSRHHDDLIERARMAIADVRRARASLAERHEHA